MSDTLGNPAMLMAAMAMRNPRGQPQPPPSGLVRGLLIGVAVAGGAIGLFLLGRKLYRDMAEDAALNRSDKEGEPESYAQRLINAFGNDMPLGLGTNEELVRDTIRAVPHLKFWEEVKAKYHSLTRGRNLMGDMIEELSTQMLSEIKLILADLPKDARDAANRDPNEITAARLRSWADRIKAACDYEASFAWPWGTDESAIHAVLMDVPTAKALCSIDKVYRTAYGKGLLAQLTEEMEGEDLTRCVQIIMDKPDAKGKTLTQALNLCR
jgi:hypothetical protein